MNKILEKIKKGLIAILKMLMTIIIVGGIFAIMVIIINLMTTTTVLIIWKILLGLIILIILSYLIGDLMTITEEEKSNIGETRIQETFLIFPKTINGKTKWFGKVKILQKCIYCSMIYGTTGWVDIEYVELKINGY